ncbi:TetR family transcriptional regulator C-terminal domain-containing protein [Pseudonocardia sp. CA-142604]|uniref:TetR family transcriptional regulator C-terminal domain-containing protein n=1 Tax=Pseudonocardia sp. CA-142604 TaxID=3240024 RepID=UPI003D8A0E8D
MDDAFVPHGTAPGKPRQPRIRSASRSGLLPRPRDSPSLEHFPGGCLLSAATFEYDSLTGPVRDAIVDGMTRWHTYLVDATTREADLGELPDGADPDQLAFELMGLFTGFNMSVHLLHDPDAATRLRQSIGRLLGL